MLFGLCESRSIDRAAPPLQDVVDFARCRFVSIDESLQEGVNRFQRFLEYTDVLVQLRFNLSVIFPLSSGCLVFVIRVLGSELCKSHHQLNGLRDQRLVFRGVNLRPLVGFGEQYE
mgnify:CR=1 FL=1